MSVLSTIRSLAESIFHRRDVEREMDEELLSHGLPARTPCDGRGSYGGAEV
jgi:hypothetical protein